MKKYVLPLLCLSLLVGCGTKPDPVPVEVETSSVADAETAPEEEGEPSFVEQLDEMKSDMVETKRRLTEGITDTKMKENIEAGVELGFLNEHSVIDNNTEENVFNSNHLRVKVPDGFTKIKYSDILIGMEKVDESKDTSIQVAFYVYDREYISKRYGEIPEDEINFTAEQVRERYMSSEEEVHDETSPVTTTVSSALVNADDRIIVKHLTTSETGSFESLSYSIWDATKPAKVISVYITVWGAIGDNVATDYDEWITGLEVR